MMAGNLPPWLAKAAGQDSNTGGGNVPKGAIARRMKKKKGKGDPDAATDAAENKRGGPSKSDPDYKEDMAGK